MKQYLLLCVASISFFQISAMDYVKRIFVKEAAHLVCERKVGVRLLCIGENLDVGNFSGTLFDAAEDNNVQGIILMINNYGGGLGVFSMLHDTLRQIREEKKKPVVALIVGNAFSCGYLLASAADYVIAHSMSELGNIGAINITAVLENIKRKTNDVECDVTMELFSAGKFKGVGGDMYTSLTQEERNYLQERADNGYKLFRNLVACNRGINPDEYEMWAEGKTFYAKQALELGLIDMIGTYFDAEKKIIELVSEYNPEISFADTIQIV